MIIRFLSLSFFLLLLFINCSTTKKELLISPKTSVILKLDDLSDASDVVHPGWENVVEFLNSQNITGTIGLIGNSLEDDNPGYFDWIRQREKEGYEIWNHGYCHCRTQDNGTEIREFQGKDYPSQLESITRTQKLAKEELGITMHTFGAPYNSTD